MSYVPYLKQPPTHTQTGNTLPSETPSTASFSKSSADQASAVKTQIDSDPYGPRQWHSNLVKLGGKNRALNEFSVERIDEDIDQNLVMLHGYVSHVPKATITYFVSYIVLVVRHFWEVFTHSCGVTQVPSHKGKR